MEPSEVEITERNNFFKICRLLIDFGRKCLLKALIEQAHPSSVSDLLVRCKPQLRKFKARVVTRKEWRMLYPENNGGTAVDGLDISLLMFVVRSCGVLPTPVTGWDEMPGEGDISVSADVVRLNIMRNMLYAHASSTRRIQPLLFRQYQSDLFAVFSRLIPEEEQSFRAVQFQCVVESDLANYRSVLQSWCEQEVTLKLTVAKLEVTPRVHSHKLDNMLTRVSNLSSRSNTGSVQLIRERLCECYNTLLSSYRPFPALSYTINLADHRFALMCHDISKFTPCEVNIGVELQLLFDRCAPPSTLNPLVVIEGCRGIGKTSLLLQHLSDWTNSGGPMGPFDLVLYVSLSDSCQQAKNILDEVFRRYFEGVSSLRKKLKHVLKRELHNTRVCFIFDYTGPNKVPSSLAKVITNCRRHCAVILVLRSFTLQLNHCVLVPDRRYQLRGLLDPPAFLEFLRRLPPLSEKQSSYMSTLREVLPKTLLHHPLVCAILVMTVMKATKTFLTPTVAWLSVVRSLMKRSMESRGLKCEAAFNLLIESASICYERLDERTFVPSPNSDFKSLLELGLLSECFDERSRKGGCFECFEPELHNFLAAYYVNYSVSQPSSGAALMPTDCWKPNERLDVVRYLAGLSNHSVRVVSQVVSASSGSRKFMRALDLFLEIEPNECAANVADLIRGLEPVCRAVEVDYRMSVREVAGLLRYMCCNLCSLTCLKADSTLPLQLFVKVLRVNKSLEQLIFSDVDSASLYSLPAFLASLPSSRISTLHIDVSNESDCFKAPAAYGQRLFNSFKAVNLKSFCIRNLAISFDSCASFDLFAASFVSLMAKLRYLDLSGLDVDCSECERSLCTLSLFLYQLLASPCRTLPHITMHSASFQFSSCDSFHQLFSAILSPRRPRNVDLRSCQFRLSCDCDGCMNSATVVGNLAFPEAPSSLHGVAETSLNLDDCHFKFSSPHQLSMLKRLLTTPGRAPSLINASIHSPTMPTLCL